MRHVIVGTAGHIDHGKTALVRALTGIDADRLKEEKQRGITIDIGFAHLERGGVQFGFVDVPGHERFIKNMLAGVHGIDIVILVVAADESIMPQTREHFDICRLLGVRAGVVALTKSDLVEPDLLEMAQAEVEDFVAGSFLDGAPVVPVSSMTGTGIGELAETLVRLSSLLPERPTNLPFRLPVDRAFTVKGFGTVLTGTLISGRVQTGDSLELLPGGKRVKVRGLQVHGETTDIAEVAQRTAVNLQGVELDDVVRGQVLAPVGRFHETSMLDVHLDLLASAPKAITHRKRVRLHHGTSEVLARIALIDRESIEPGESAVVQIRLEAPILALPGDRFIVRSYSPQATIGGGVVIDALPAKHKRSDAGAREWLEELERTDFAGQIGMRLDRARGRGMTLEDLAAETGAADEDLAIETERLAEAGRAIEVDDALQRWITADAFRALGEATIAAVESFHARDPLAPGIPLEELRGAAFSRLPLEVFRAVTNQLTTEGALERDRDVFRRAGRGSGLSSQEESEKARFEDAVRESGMTAATVADVSTRVGLPGPKAKKYHDLLMREGKVVRLGDLVFHSSVLADLKERVRQRGQTDRELDIAAFRDLTGGVSRKYAIPLLEWLDRERVTRRVGDHRQIVVAE